MFQGKELICVNEEDLLEYDDDWIFNESEPRFRLDYPAKIQLMEKDGTYTVKDLPQ